MSGDQEAALAVASAAALLLRARREAQPIPGLPGDCRPQSKAEGYRIQKAFVAGSGGKPVGYKIGCTSQRAQAALHVDAPIAGRVLSDSLVESPAALPAGRFIFRMVEPEFAFRLGRPLPARAEAYFQDEVADAVASLHPAIEIVSSSFGAGWTDAGAAQLIADNSAHGALVLGPATTAWRDLDLAAWPVSLFVDGERAGSGSGANALGHPLNALTWLANHCADRGDGLAADEVVTTGVVTELLDLQAGQKAVADFGDLGLVEVRFDP